MKRKQLLRTTGKDITATPLASVSDAALWKYAVTPTVKAFLGPVVGEGFSRHTDEIQGLFPGDEVSNLNGWRRADGTSATRFPYLATYYRTENGALVIKRDGVKFKVFAWLGDVLGGKPGELIFSFALRDRRFDGTARANDTALLDFPYDDPGNKPLLIHGKELVGTSCETSLYSYLPRSGIARACGDATLEDFVAKPFTYIDRPEEFLRYFRMALNSDRFPGQVAVPIPDVGKSAHAAWEKLAIAVGYDFLETAPSHVHVYGWNCAKGYRASNPAQAATIAEFQAKVEALRKQGVKISRLQESWLFPLQSLPVEHIPEPFYLGGLTWPQNNIDQNNLWLYKPLSEKAREQVAGLTS